MEDKLALKPCPFCNDGVVFNYNIDLEPDGIKCWNCHYILRFLRVRHQKKDAFEVTMTKMAEAWNRRAGEI